jgi:flagellar FliL protein
MPLLIGLFLAAAAGAGGFFAVSSGMFTGERTEKTAEVDKPKMTYIPLEPLVISIGEQGRKRHLRFAAQLEVKPDKAEAVTGMLPRITDVLNGYLRAITLADIEDPSALLRVRAQMLRRVQIVVGEGAVGDLLVMEFVLS